MLRIPHLTHKSFKKHFIKNAFVDLRFSQKKIDWNNIQKSLAESLKSLSVTNVMPAFNTNFHFSQGPADKTHPTLRVQSQQTGLVASSADNSFTLDIRDDRYIFNVQRYHSFHQFWKQTSDILNVVAPIVGTEKYNWLGIRKVNQIAILSDEHQYKGEGVNTNFFTPIANGSFDPGSFQFGDNRYVLTQGKKTCILHTVCQRQANKNEFLLQIDIDANQVIDGDGLVLNALEPAATELNGLLFDAFCWVAAPDLLKTLEE